MMKRTLFTATAATALAVAAMTVNAQQRPDSPSRPQTPPGSRPGTTPAGQTGQQAQAGNVQFKQASDLIGMNVVGQTGENFGEIDNLAFDADHGQVAFVLLSPDEELNLENQLLAIPWDSFEFQRGMTATLTVDKNRLQQAPKIQEGSFNQLRDKQFATQVYQHYNAQPYWTKAPTSRPSGMDQPGQRPTTPPGQSDQPGQRPGASGQDRPTTPGQSGAQASTGQLNIVLASEALDHEIQSAQNEELGQIDDFIIESNQGRIGYAIVSFGGMVGIGEKTTAVPWQALNVRASSPESVTLTLNVDRQKLEQAPEFDENQIQQLADQRYAQRIHEVYGTDPGWVYGFAGAGAGAAGRPQGGMEGEGAWMSTDEYMRLYSPQQATQTVRGSVTGIQSFTPAPGKAQGMALSVRGDDQQTHTVHLGPEWYMENQPQQIRQGAQVTVIGARATFQGQPVLIAKEVRMDGQTLMLRDEQGHPMWLAWRGGAGTTTTTPTPRPSPMPSRPPTEPPSRPGQPDRPGQPGEPSTPPGGTRP